MTENVIQVGSAASMAGGYPGMRPEDQQDEVVEHFSSATVLGDLRAALAQDVSVEPIALNVPNRPNINMMFRPSIDFDLLRRWTKAARENRNKQDSPVDQKKLCSMVLAETCCGMQFRALKKDGTHVWVDMFGEHDGEPLTFRHREVQSNMGAIAGSWLSAIEKMYGSDGHIIMVAKIVLDKAGYGDIDLEEGSDPLDN